MYIPSYEDKARKEQVAYDKKCNKYRDHARTTFAGDIDIQLSPRPYVDIVEGEHGEEGAWVTMAQWFPISEVTND